MAKVKARVLPNNNYGGLKAGSILDVEESELARVPHCLVGVEAEKIAKAAAETVAAEKQAASQSMFDNIRASIVEQGKQSQEALVIRKEREAAQAAVTSEAVKKLKK